MHLLPSGRIRLRGHHAASSVGSSSLVPVLLTRLDSGHMRRLFRHVALLLDTGVLWPRVKAAGCSRFGEKSSVRRGMRGEAKSPDQARWQLWGTTVWTARFTGNSGRA